MCVAMQCNKLGECAVGCGFFRMALYDFFLSKYCHENQKKLGRFLKETSFL